MHNANLQNHIEFLLSAAMRQCNNLADAQDLTQETLLAALTFCEKGGAMEDPKAWLLSVMRRKYYDLLRRKYQRPTVTIGADFDIIDDADVAEDLIGKEEAEQVRREVAYLAETYRNIIARHYFHRESVQTIAEHLHLPEGTVKSRLDFGRKQLKKGFESMEKYTQNSYMPQGLHVCNSGRCGLNDEPMSLTENDALAQNLLILAYDKPIGITDLAKAIGVAAAYVEPVVNKLVDGELMRRMGDGKVYTDFILYHAEDFVKYMKEQEQFAADYADAYCEPLRRAIEELCKTDFYSQRLERYMMIRIAENGLYTGLKKHRAPQVFPERPNGGRWIAFGTVYPRDYTIPKEKRGKEEYHLAGRRRTCIEQYLDAKNLKIYNYESSLYPYPKHAGYGYSSFQDVEHDMLKLFYLIKHNIAPETMGCDPRILKGIPLLEKRGFLTAKGGTPELLIPCLTHVQEKEFDAICERASTAFAAAIEQPLAAYVSTHKKKIPLHLTSVPDQKRTMPYEPRPMMFVFAAIEKGMHPRDLGYPCPETFVVLD
ncbi:MAG: sigma-70 family RNA polymerase sigma factor [Clostridia bacterium]|nr:sigma-70 family RNA polymerase sigma factor [Clostridia bacterium]